VQVDLVRDHNVLQVDPSATKTCGLEEVASCIALLIVAKARPLFPTAGHPVQGIDEIAELFVGLMSLR